MKGCPAWCVQTTPHGAHLSAPVVMHRGPAAWHVSLGQVTDGSPHLNIVYLGERAPADASWHPALADAAQYASFAARLGEAQVAAAITTVAARAGELVSAT